jgi:hypothetical protein
VPGHSPGTRLRSVECATEVVLTMGALAEGALTCGGEPMVPRESSDDASELPPGDPVEDRALLGKRYRSPDGTVEVLCTHQGRGELAIDAVRLEMVKPKLLPASD